MSYKLDKMPLQDLVHDLVYEKVNVNDLSLNKKTQRDAFFEAIKERPNLLSRVKGENSMHFLKPALEVNPTNFIYLTEQQYNDELAEMYLSYRLNTKNESIDVNPAESSKWFTTHNSIDGKIILDYNYVTPNGEELYYFDNELNVPISIKSNFKISLKINHALTFIKKIDIHVTQLGKSKVESVIADSLDNQYRMVLSNYISKKKIGYYTLSTSISDFENELQNKLESLYKPFGIEVNKVIIRKFAIPKTIQNQIEDQAFEFRQLRADMDASVELANKSLQYYESKLSIEQKYPDAEHSLTEYEKDLALKRYLIKTGQLSKETLDRNININRQVEKGDKTLNKQEDISPEIPPKANIFKATYIALLVISIIINIAVLFTAPGSGLIYLGVNLAVFGSVATVYKDKFKNNKVELESQQDTPSNSQDPTSTVDQNDTNTNDKDE